MFRKKFMKRSRAVSARLWFCGQFASTDAANEGPIVEELTLAGKSDAKVTLGR